MEMRRREGEASAVARLRRLFMLVMLGERAAGVRAVAEREQRLMALRPLPSPEVRVVTILTERWEARAARATAIQVIQVPCRGAGEVETQRK
jgi:hypothetical protein